MSISNATQLFSTELLDYLTVLFYFSVIAFGCGLRLCPGEMFAKTRFFLIIAILLQRWTFEFPSGNERSCDPRKTENFDFKAILRAQPFFCCAKERQ